MATWENACMLLSEKRRLLTKNVYIITGSKCCTAESSSNAVGVCRDLQIVSMFLKTKISFCFLQNTEDT